MAKTTAPTFGSIDPTDLPETKRQPSGDTLALGQAILAAMANGKAAHDPATYPERADAVKRAAVLRRALAAVAKDRAVTSRVYQIDGTGPWHVAILDKPTEAAAETDAETPAE